MGASNGIINGNTSIYISYSLQYKDNLYLQELQKNMIEQKINVFNSENTYDLLQHLDGNLITESIKNILDKTRYFIICVTKKTISSYHQAIEINNSIEYNKEILYLITDKLFTPENNIFVNSLVKNKKWLLFYNDQHLIECLQYLSQLNL
jgi:uncharacterized protein (DUF2344 family)